MAGAPPHRAPARAVRGLTHCPWAAAAAAVAESRAAFYLVGMEEPTVDLYMTPAPQTISQDQPLAEAHRLMREHAIRHLPVLDGERLVGLVSQRDLHFFETLDGVDPEAVTVLEAMSEEPYAVEPRTTVREVAAHMADHKLGSAVVVEGGQVVGIFTAVDGLRGLSLLLQQLLQASR